MREFLADLCRRLELSNRRMSECFADKAEWWNDAREWVRLGGDWQEIRDRTAKRKRKKH